MCGIAVLVTKKLTYDQLKTFEKVFKEQESRGGDSAGIYLCSEHYKQNIYNLNRWTKPVFKNAFILAVKNGLIGSPCVILGHTRASATGSRTDYHPAESMDSKVISIHNGVISDDESYYYHMNDTYHLVNVLSLEATNKKKLRALKDRIYTSGSTIFNINLNYKLLDFLSIGYTPLEHKKTKNYEMFCSETRDKSFRRHKKGFYKMSLETLFNRRQIRIKKGIKYINTYSDSYYWTKEDYNIYNTVKGDDKGGIDDNTIIYLKDDNCSLSNGLKCIGCFDCLNASNEIKECKYYYGECIKCGECVFNKNKLEERLK